MRADDKKIRDALKELKIPVSYKERVDEVLASLPDREKNEQEQVQQQILQKQVPKTRKKYIFRAAACLLCICLTFFAVALRSNARYWEGMKKTLLEFLGFTTKEEAKDNGIDSNPLYVESKRDLFVELTEQVIDAHNIYLLVKITAPADVVFSADVGFDYYAFCSGENYNADHLLGGSRDCKLLESLADKPNEAFYVLSVNTFEEIPEGTPVTCFLQNLCFDPYGENCELLVEGIWSMTFSYGRTVVESVTVSDRPDMKIPFLDGNAAVERIELTPLGMSLTMDISDVTYDLIGISDNTVVVKLLLIDGSEKTICSHDPNENFFQSGGNLVEIKGERVIEQQNFEFPEILDIGKVIGFYVEDLYIPVE